MSVTSRLLLIGCLGGVVILVAAIALHMSKTPSNVHYHTFNIEVSTVKRLCKEKNIVTVNGQLPGPTLHVRNGDTLVVKVNNRAPYNATIHWHGVRQIRTGWSDGPEYITQCPIQPGGSYTYRFSIDDKEGTLWWHAHVSWLRATVHGALVIYPKKDTSYPFAEPKGEATIILGEWWNSNPIDVVNEAILSGAGPNVSDAFTINGQPGDLYPCSNLDTFRLPVMLGETYLLRIVNAALNTQLFFKIAEHDFIVVAADACYTKPYSTNVLVIAPGQTTDILLTTNAEVGRYYMTATPYSSSDLVNFDTSETAAILEYQNTSPTLQSPIFPDLPLPNDTSVAKSFRTSLRSLDSTLYPTDVPLRIHEDVISTVGLGLNPCPLGQTCQGPNGQRFTASMNNISFVMPTVSILEAYYSGINGVFTTDFPDSPPISFDYTAQNIPASLWTPVPGTKVKVIEFNSNVQWVFQGTNIVAGEDHPMHLHGYDFYVVGEGSGNYDPLLDPVDFNLVDPPKRNTVIVPVNGWTAIRFKADNPGAWLLHCHLDVHLSWGLKTVLLVTNGNGVLDALETPPQDFPVC
ncbi:hypothetical protein SUGI_1109640 [Cryptomeria japonica]|uniref:laccase-12 n=1 Tax=Cryptomeria japonica TaxID=3369 RepID=UPI002414919C|nr:laccase-12 [Cryptomeria japonica]GLJ52167.1 hypothetical protein SUGI_1109640 [Cryptomeria japonica]